MKNFILLLKTEFKRILSNNILVMIFFGAPISYGILFGYVYQQAKVIDLPISVIDMDNSPLSNQMIEALDDNETIKVSDIRADAGNIVTEMPEKEYVAIITIPEGFEGDILQKRYPELQVDLNMSNILNANFITKGIQLVLGTLNAGIEIETLKKQGNLPQEAIKMYEPFKVSFNKLYNPSGNYSDFMMPGLMGGIMQQVIFLGLALSFARDFEDGYFKTLTETSTKSIYLVFLKMLPFLLFIPIMWGVIGLIFQYFDIHLAVFNFPMLVLIVGLSFASIFIGMLFSTLIPNQLKATELLMVISTPAFVLSGFTWPQSAMPPLIAKVAQLIPLSHFLEGFKKVAIYGGGMQDIKFELNALALISLVCFVLINIVIQVKISMTTSKSN